MLGSTKLYRVNKGDLLEKIKLNRASHAIAYKAAVVKYRERAVVALTKQLANAQEASKRFSLSFTLPKPVNYLKQYDQLIGLLEMATEQFIEITPQDYSCYVLDEWEWRSNFAYATMSYNAVTGPTGPTGSQGAGGAAGPSGFDRQGDDVTYGPDDGSDDDE